jgi:hypothetical protein
MRRWRIVSATLMLAAGTAGAQLQGPGLTLPPLGADRSLELAPGVGLRGWVGGRPGLLASDGVVASSMVLADWYPLASGFRVTGGLAYGSARLDASAPMSHGIDSPLRSAGSGGVALDPRSWVARGNPYLGVGWERGLSSGSGPYMSADLGVMYQRGSLATWGCPGGVAVGPCGVDVRAFDGAGYADETRFAPMMSLGVGLRF